jgi:type II restriction/modification system DNA methylase subunit YeeA
VSPEQFIKKWTAANLSERSASQQHFLDLCQLLGEPTPADADPTGETFTFEKGGTTATGGHGWADVWKKGAFAWEYKGPGKDLNAAYVQLKKYADMLENPPLLITSDTKRIEIHTNFTSTVKIIYALELSDLALAAKRDLLRAAFKDPEKLRPGTTRQQVTTEAAESFSQLAHHLQTKGYDPKRVAHFLNRIVFCMFAEDVGLLPNRIFSKLATASVAHPESFEANAKQLFGGMSKGGAVAFEVIDWFNGGLFDDDATLPLDKTELQIVLKCAELDWSNIEPSVFGTLFERGLDPDKRSQQGTHYTDPATIMKIVGPVVLEPWVRQWEAEKEAIAKQVDRAKKTVSEAAKQRYYAFLERVANFKVLDPACGSGNFLYLALRALKDFEKRVIHDAETLGMPQQFPRVGPEAVLGIEVNPYAAELARVTIWIGELQWMIENGFGASKNPILKPLDQIECRDAIVNEDGTEPAWPKADVIVGNPPFLGDRFHLRELGEEYTGRLRKLYRGRVPGRADLVVYWFHKAVNLLLQHEVTRFGLVGTKSIAKGASRRPLEELLANGGEIERAWTNEPWVNEGAAVRVAIVCAAENGLASAIVLNDQPSIGIAADLTPVQAFGAITDAFTLTENGNVAFQGVKLTGAFDVGGDVARQWLLAHGNPNGRPNSDVLRRLWDIDDLVGRPSDRWVIDFGCDTDLATASGYEMPFEYVRDRVPQQRATIREARLRETYWLFQRPRPALRRAIAPLRRYIVTPESSEHRVFRWAATTVLPVGSVFAIARDDDASFGILQSSLHEAWATAQGNRLGVGNQRRYNITVTFETFPFPTGLTPNYPAEQFSGDDRAKRIAIAAERLNEMRENWLNPPELVGHLAEVVSGYPDRLVPKSPTATEELKGRTLTDLYNANPAWLQHAHEELDEAVAAAYGWEWPLSDDEILKRLFELNQTRVAPPKTTNGNGESRTATLALR